MTSRPHLLLVEDDRPVSVLLERALAGHGYRVTCIDDGVDAYAAVSSTHFDLILVDHLLPRMLGSELVDRIRADGVATPVIMISGVTGEEDVVRALEAGAIDYIRKPFELREVLARVAVHTRTARGG